MIPASLIDSLPRLNDRYRMFSELADVEGQEATFHFSAKDNLTAKGLQARAGSRILEGYRPPFDATPIRRMRESGGLLLGKTNMDEFGFGTFCTNSAFGVPRNPYDLERSCGGSSGGAACAAAVIEGHVAIGVSTGGSISCPASFCGVYGLTPTYGRVSRYGLIDYGNSLDKPGLLSRNVMDLRRHLPTICGKDVRDPTSCVQPELTLDGKVTSVAIPLQAVEGLAGGVRTAFEEAVSVLEDGGITVKGVDMPSLRFALPAYYILATSEASTNLARYCGMRYGPEGGDLNDHFNDYFSDARSEHFGTEAKRRVLLGTFSRMVGFRDRYYMKALQVRELIITEYEKVFKEHDLLLTPTMPFVAPRFTEIERMRPLDMYKADFLTVPPNLAGLPHLSAPCGLVDGMPVGMQFVAPHWMEGILIAMAEGWGEAFDVPEAGA